ncbi:MAG: acyltransferase [Candidatus Peribacteraceae bacterium]|nr:acyltransferase [Candidatus Peribacteraceae bacterium]
MTQALREIGIGKALKYCCGQVQIALLKSELLLSPFRVALLKIFGMTIGRDSVIHACTFFNVYRGGFSKMRIGHHCFIGNECLLDLADTITLGNYVTIAERVSILTHTSVGFKDHPLHAKIPATMAGVTLGSGAFIGLGATIMPGVTIGENAIVGACSLVRDNVAAGTTVVGVPARPV